MPPRPPNPADADLVAKAIAGDREAFGDLYEHYLPAIYRYVFYRVGDAGEAEDLTETVFVKAWEALERYRPTEAPFAAWLYRIAHNAVANWHRDEARRQALPLNGVALTDLHAEAPEETLDERRQRELLLRALRRLPGERQQLIILKFVEQMSNVEIGLVMNRSEGAVKSLYHRTLLALRDELAQLEARPAAAGTPSTT